MLTPTEYVRKPFVVEGVQVDATNIDEVAEWCKGEVTLDIPAEEGKPEARYVKVKVHRAMNERQTRAYIGDWVLFSESGFKVYTTKAFDSSFQLKAEPKIAAPIV